MHGKLVLKLALLLVLLAACSSPPSSSPPPSSPSPSPVIWTRQFGTRADDHAHGVAVDSVGNVLVAGYTRGVFGRDWTWINYDSFVFKYAHDGQVRWTWQPDSSGSDYALAVAVDSVGNVLVAGYYYEYTYGWDPLVRKRDKDGNPRWVRWFETREDDFALAVAVDSLGNVLVAGYTRGTLGQTSAGGWDAFVVKYDKDGNLRWTRQFGTNADDYALAVAVDGEGNVLVAGYTFGTLLGQTRADEWDAFVVKYDKDGNPLWTKQFGTNADDYAHAVAVDGDGNVLVAGRTLGTLGQARVGFEDAFVRKYDKDGKEVWTRQFGTNREDKAYGVAVDKDGNVLVAGVTDGTFLGQTWAGSYDAFVRKYDRDGKEVWTRQFGTADWDEARAVAVDGNGNVLVAGKTTGTFPGQTRAGDWDAFVRKYRP